MTEIKLDRQPPLAWVTLDRPAKRNAITSAMWQQIPVLARALDSDETVRVILFRGAGGEAFSAGADIDEMRANLNDAAAMRAMQAAVQAGQAAWAQLRKPTLALIDGACTGGGCGLALACDLRLATPRSFFAVPPARLGLVYSLADTSRLIAAVGVPRAKEILFTGRRIDANEALAIGLVNAVVQADELTARGDALARDIAAGAQNSVRAAKRIADLIASGTTAETAETRQLYDQSFSSPEFREGAQAFYDKRKPKF